MRPYGPLDYARVVRVSSSWDEPKGHALTMTINQLVGQAIVDARQEAGVSQYGLAKRLGWSTPRLAHYEKGRNALSVPQLLQITVALGDDRAMLLDRLAGITSSVDCRVPTAVSPGLNGAPSRVRYWSGRRNRRHQAAYPPDAQYKREEDQRAAEAALTAADEAVIGRIVAMSGGVQRRAS